MTDIERRELWIEMSIREIWTQCHFAEISYKNIDKKSARPTDMAFSSIHSFLSHCTMVSKLLKGSEMGKDGEQIGQDIGQILGIDGTSVIHRRKFRNHLEHYDERLKGWIDRYEDGTTIGTYNIGPKSMFDEQNTMFISHHDNETKTFTFLDQDLDLGELYNEIERVKELANSWVKSMEKDEMIPPIG